MPESAWYVIPGVNPIPWTAPEVAIGRKNGKPFPIVHSAAELKNYKEAVAEGVRERYPDTEMIEDEIALTFFFYRQLPVYEKGAKGRKSRSHVADATNMQKATEDALQGVLFKNDRQVVHAESWVMSQAEDTDPLIVVNLVWHPPLPELPEFVTSIIDEHPSFDLGESNEHDVPVEDFF